MENFILYDWLSFTVKTNDPLWVIDEMLGLGQCPWETIKGARGYQDRLYFSSISVHYNGREDMGVWVELSGQGCRTFETLTDFPDKWEDIFKTIADNRAHITRLDVAYDDHTGLLDIDELIQDTRKKEYISKSGYWEIIESSKGQSMQFGSPQSDVLIRIYDKARERNCPEGEHWIRCELQLRNDRAAAFTKLPTSIGESYYGVVYNYLRFVIPDEFDTNKWRWPMKVYWCDFLHDAHKISIYQAPGVDYNMDRLKKFVFNQAGNATSAYIKMNGVDNFLQHLNDLPVKPNPKYDRLVAEHGVFNPNTKHKPTQVDYYEEEIRIKSTFNPVSKTPTYDRFNRRWLYCSSCMKVLESKNFSMIGGKYGVNKALCTQCEEFG